MVKASGIIIAFIVAFGAGYLFAKWNFVYSDTYELKEPISIIANESGEGILPKGTRLHYQSSAHNEVDFYVFVRIPMEKAKLKTEKVEVDYYYGIKRLRGNFE